MAKDYGFYDIPEFFLCKDYKRVQLDFDEIQRHPNNPKDSQGYPIFPVTIHHNKGSSYTYKVSDDYFFKRNLQDGNNQASDDIISLHHYNKAFNALFGSLDDLAEVMCYTLSKNMVNPKTGKRLVDIAEYKLATYTDEKGILLRGCLTKNVCENLTDELISMSDMLSSSSLSGNSIDIYMQAIEKYCKRHQINFNQKLIRRELIKNSYFSWKVANSDNHKNNITFIIETDENKNTSLKVSPLIDNGSAYELSSPYITNGTNKPRFQLILENDEHSKINENGERVFDFKNYPNMHTSFHLDNSKLLFSAPVNNENRSFSYEYALASEMLEDPELFFEIAEIEKQFNLQLMEAEIDRTYGSAGQPINWPPLLKEFMQETTNYKSKILAYAVADYYLHTTYSVCIESIDRNNPSETYNKFKQLMLNLPLQENKESYDTSFVNIAENLGIKINKTGLNAIKFQKQTESKKEKQLS